MRFAHERTLRERSPAGKASICCLGGVVPTRKPAASPVCWNLGEHRGLLVSDAGGPGGWDRVRMPTLGHLACRTRDRQVWFGLDFLCRLLKGRRLLAGLTFLCLIFGSASAIAQEMRFASWPELVALIPCNHVIENEAGGLMILGPVSVEEHQFYLHPVISLFEVKELRQRCSPRVRRPIGKPD